MACLITGVVSVRDIQASWTVRAVAEGGLDSEEDVKAGHSIVFAVQGEVDLG
jgi:hypothetical protein